MIFDNNNQRFTEFIEDKHIQTMNSANKFLNVKAWKTFFDHQHRHSEVSQDMELSANMSQTVNPIVQNPANVQEEKTHIPSVMFESSAYPFDDEQFQKYYYEYTGFPYNDNKNWRIWWKKHQEFGTWYTNIKTTEDKVMWVKYNIWWDSLNMIKDIDETIRAIRVEFCKD